MLGRQVAATPIVFKRHYVLPNLQSTDCPRVARATVMHRDARMHHKSKPHACTCHLAEDEHAILDWVQDARTRRSIKYTYGSKLLMPNALTCSQRCNCPCGAVLNGDSPLVHVGQAVCNGHRCAPWLEGALHAHSGLRLALAGHHGCTATRTATSHAPVYASHRLWHCTRGRQRTWRTTPATDTPLWSMFLAPCGVPNVWNHEEHMPATLTELWSRQFP